MKTAVVLILAIISQAIGNVCLTKGMKALVSSDDAGNWLSFLQGAIHSPHLWVGTVFLTGFFILFSAALSWADLSFVLPATSFGYVLNVACGYYILNESVSQKRWVGALVITLGVVLVSRSGSRTVKTGAGEPSRLAVGDE
jgi:drug/metabolite transporter (DMT)-like permease